MPDIRTRDAVKGTIKAIDKSAVAAQSMKDTLVKAKEKAEHSTRAKESNPEEYAANRITDSADTAVYSGVQLAKKAARKGKAAVSDAKNSLEERKAARAAIAETKAMISALTAGGGIAVFVILVVVLLGVAVALFGRRSSTSSYTPVSAEVEAYTPIITIYARQHGIPEDVELIKAVMMQESGGQGGDPMQCSESGYNTRYPHYPNAITDPEYSIDVGGANPGRSCGHRRARRGRRHLHRGGQRQ